MRREAFILLVGASLVGSTDVEGQRNRDRDRDRNGNGRVERLEPVRAPGRVVARPVYRGAPTRAHGSSRVVYSTRRGYRGHAGWVRVDWGHRAIRTHGRAPRYRSFMNRGDLKAMLGNRTVRQIADAGRSAGLRGPMRGHWVIQRGAPDLLVVTIGGSDAAELVDFNRDGILDEMYIVGPRGYRWTVAGR